MTAETSIHAPARSFGMTGRIAAALGAGALLTLAGAWFFQIVLGIKPCPLCLEQRYAYYLTIPLAVLAGLLAAKHASRGALIGLFAIIALAMIANAGLGAYHAGVEWKFWQGPTECSGSAIDLGGAGDLLSRLDSVKVVRCDDVQWRFLGLSLAGYNVLISLTLAALAAIGARAAARGG